MQQFIENDDYNKAISSFLEEFEKGWNDALEEINIEQAQLQIGSRLRPLIVFWGYLCSCNTEAINDISYESVAKISVSIELLHKASLLLDDWLDNDKLRHGKPSFHVEFGVEFTVMYALYLVSIASLNISKALDSNVDISTHILCLQNIHNTIHSMSLGAVMELSLKKEDLFDLEKINTIAKLETAEIIGNSLQLGYLVGQNYNENVFALVHTIGIQCGYLFQSLNDFEAFSNIIKNIEHKGNVNYDFDNGKKNIVIAMLHNLVSKKDKEIMKNCSGEEISRITKKYNFKDFFITDMKIVYNNLLENIKSLELYGVNSRWINAFSDFIEYAKKIAYSKLY